MYREKMEVKDEEFVDLDRKSYQVKVTNISFQYLTVNMCITIIILRDFLSVSIYECIVFFINQTVLKFV